MNILFGPEHDSVYIDPMQPGAYEWWYFDALSDDGKLALCVVFSLGSPMTPYYKAVVDGMHPLPCDWCGVSITLHELEQGEWKTRAYAYNLYRYRKNQSGWFLNNPLRIGIGGSELQGIYPPDSSGFPQRWQIAIDEPGLWSGRTKATLDFTILGPPLTHEPLNTDTDPHTWVCVAPLCTISGEISQPDGQKVSFSGRGYHDHHYGQLPWGDVELWHWGRFLVKEGNRRFDAAWLANETEADREDWKRYLESLRHVVGTAICYRIQRRESLEKFAMILDENANPILLTSKLAEARIDPQIHEITIKHGMRYSKQLGWKYSTEPLNGLLEFDFSDWRKSFSKEPFYVRMPVSMRILGVPKGSEKYGFFDINRVRSSFDGGGRVIHWGDGIGEVFWPNRLCHPLWSRLMWLWMRRRS